MTTKGERDFRWEVRSLDKNIPKLKQLFSQMWKDYDEYIRLTENDFPFWSTEWNLVGHMAVAASKLGPVALEYSEKKQKGTKTRRPDAWFRMSQSEAEADRDLVIEAKRDCLSWAASEKTMVEYVKEYFDECRKYLKRLNGYDAPVWSAPIFFLQFYAPRSAINARYSDSIDSLVTRCGKAFEQIGSECRNPFFGYYFLTPTQAKEAKEDNYHYPGIVIFGDLQKVKK
jgi:hypothetical protein